MTKHCIQKKYLGCGRETRTEDALILATSCAQRTLPGTDHACFCKNLQQSLQVQEGAAGHLSLTSLTGTPTKAPQRPSEPWCKLLGWINKTPWCAT